jgi:hypothetical protein
MAKNVSLCGNSKFNFPKDIIGRMSVQVLISDMKASKVVGFSIFPMLSVENNVGPHVTNPN